MKGLKEERVKHFGIMSLRDGSGGGKETSCGNRYSQRSIVLMMPTLVAS